MRLINYWQPRTLCVFIWVILVTPDRGTPCGGVFTSQRGVIHTPNFPGRFPVPIYCEWVIDSSRFQEEAPSKIILYFTQNYLTSDLTVIETKSMEKMIIEIDGKQCEPEKRTMHIYTPDTYLVIRADLKTLEGNHLRFLDDQKNVYYMFGFNATYEIVPIDEPIRKSCTPQICSLLGDCYADSEMKKFACKCFYGYGGEHCTQGPLCDAQPCKNGGTCVHLSAVAFSCSCPSGYNGTSCEFTNPVDAKTQCPISGSLGNNCRCSNPQPVLPDRVRYLGKIKMSNLSMARENWHANYGSDEHIAKLLAKALRNSSLSLYDKLAVQKTTVIGERKFHFIGLAKERNRIRDIFNQLEEEGKLFDVNLNRTFQPLTKEPVLNLLSLVAPKKSVELDEEFMISCVAEGSVYMDFTFFKDGAKINASLSHRSLSIHMIDLPEDGRFQYTLVIGKANLLDQGMFTCRVRDYGMEQCSSVYITVPTRPEITLFPMSVTVERGENVDLRCIPSNKVPARDELAYTWAKNEVLIKSKKGEQVEEDLHLNDYAKLINGGSVLEITDIRKSATYTCKVSGTRAKSVQSVWVEVVDNRSSSTLCQPEGAFGVAWPLTISNVMAQVSCPSGADGVAKRDCLQTLNSTTKWGSPDFSQCVYNDVRAIARNITLVTLGYDVTDTTATLKKLANALISRRIIRPGEGAKILELLELILRHLNRPTMAGYVAESVTPFYFIIDFLLKHEYSLLTDSQIQLLQKLVRKHGLIWAGMLPNQSSEIVHNMPNIFIETASVGPESSNLKFPTHSVGWFNNSLEISINPAKVNSSRVSVVVIGYRRLNQFLPKRYLQKESDGSEIEYELNSQIISIDSSSTRFASDAFYISLYIEPLLRDFDARLWTWTCAWAESAGTNPNWDLRACYGTIVAGNTTRCICHKPGTVALLLVSRPRALVTHSTYLIHTPVSIGCICCLVQCILTLSLLLPHWWRHRTCVVFLKIQCCVSLIGAMTIFICSVQTSVPKSLFPTLIAFLELFLLLPLTGHLSILLIIFTEVMQIPTVSRRIKQCIVCITTGAPILAVLANLLSNRSTGWPPGSWWLQPNSMAFTVFVTSAIITCGLFGFLYVMVLRKLRVLCVGNSEKNRAVLRRLGLLKRCGFVFITLVLMELASILYINIPKVTYQYFFGITSALLGLVMLICYAVKSESPPYLRLLKKLKMDPTTPDEFSSDSAISPLNFFTKQDREQESEAAAPRRAVSVRVRDCDHQADPAAVEQLLLQENHHHCPGKSNSDDVSTLETYVYGDGCVLAAGNAVVPSHSPARYKPMTSFRVQEGLGFGDYVEQEMPEPVGKPLPVQSYILDPKAVLPTEMITTRVCVELGVITTHQRNEVTGLEENAPALVLCSVDVEPCQSRIITAQQFDGERVLVSADNETAGVVVCSVDVDQTGLIAAHLEARQKTEPVTQPAITIGPETNGPTVTVPISNGNPKISDITNGDEKSSNEENMMDRISHDLDYLLNRKSELFKPVKEVPKKRFSVKNDVLEELDEEEAEEEENCSGPFEYLAKC